MVLLSFIFENINSEQYNELLMFDLPLVFESNKLEVNDFFSRDSIEQNKVSLIEDMCNMESQFLDIQLPAFSDVPIEYIPLSHFKHPNNLTEELTDFIKVRHKNSKKDKT